jgi:DNA-binding XRE family transcriptional regulator
MNNVARAREEKGWSQSFLAKQVRKTCDKFPKVGQEHISRIEREAISPSVKLAIIIARVLDSTVEDLFVSDCTAPNNAEVSDDETTS